MLYARLTTLLVLTMIATLGFIAVYFFGGQTQWAAATIGSASVTLTLAMIIYAHHIAPKESAIEERGCLYSGDAVNDAAAQTLLDGAGEVISRRGWFNRLVLATVSILGIAALMPFGSLGKKGVAPADFGKTSWRKGLRLVREDGTPVHVSDLEIDSIITVFPEGFTGPQFADTMANDAVVVLRVPTEELTLPAGRTDWAPRGLIAFSKVCTHAGCPVALYRAAARQLFCPCHQSTFDVRTGAKPIFGPADRNLPQLPLAIAADGSISATGDFSGPIGPSYWSRA